MQYSQTHGHPKFDADKVVTVSVAYRVDFGERLCTAFTVANADSLDYVLDSWTGTPDWIEEASKWMARSMYGSMLNAEFVDEGNVMPS